MATQSKKTSKTNTSKTKKPTAAAKKATKPVVKTVKVTKESKATVAKAPKKKASALFRRASNKSARTGSKLSAALMVSWQKWLAFLFAAQGVAILLLSDTALISVNGNYLAKDALASQGGEAVHVTALSRLFDVDVAYLLAGICFVFALASLLLATVYRASYEQALERGVNRFRWVTFSFGLGGLVLLLGLLAGVRDVAGLLALFVLTATVSMVGLGLELLSATQAQARSVVSGIGTIAWLTLWAVLALYFVYAGVFEGNVPNYVYYVATTMLVLSVALTSVLRKQQLGAGKWAEYVRAERAYTAISFVLVSAVTWQVFVGILQP